MKEPTGNSAGQKPEGKEAEKEPGVSGSSPANANPRFVEDRNLEAFGLPSEVFFKAVEQAPVAISITDTKANVLYANHAFTRVTGFAFDDVNHRNESLLSDRRTPSIVYESLWSALLRHRPWTGRLVNRRKDGVRYLAELTVAPVLDDAKTTIHYLGMHRDVTEEHTLLQEVQNQRQLIDNLLDAAPMWFAVIGDNGHAVLTNATFREACQVCDKDLAPWLVQSLCGDMDEQFSRLRNARAPIPEREELVPTQNNVQMRVALSARWLDESDSTADGFFRSGGQRYLMVFGSDVTSLRQQEEQLRTNAMLALLAEEERVQELQEILNAAVFRFEIPLNLLATALRAAEKRAGDATASKALLESVRAAVTEGRNTLKSLVASIPEMPATPLEDIDVQNLLRDVVRLVMHRLMAQDIVVDLSIGRVPTIRGHAAKLRSMFKELIDNAIEAMGSSTERGILVEAAVAGGRLVISVSDTGPGIPEALHFKVFEPFFSRSKNKRDGAGMGLARVQNVVNDHGGAVYVDSNYRRGCRIVVELPTDWTGQER